MSVAMEYGVILKWLKNEGDKVKKGEPVVEIFGEKNEFELESPADGFLLKTLCEVNDEIPISEPIAIIGKKGEEIPDVTPKKLSEGATITPTTAVAATPAQSVQTAPTTKQTKSTATLQGGRIKASPRAKKRAIEQGINLAMIIGSGPEGRIVEKDVLEYKSTPFAIGDVRIRISP
ncbi:MAG: E3 binding domain-containing protein [Candidatus Thorarchaeota archaeon]